MKTKQPLVGAAAVAICELRERLATWEAGRFDIMKLVIYAEQYGSGDELDAAYRILAMLALMETHIAVPARAGVPVPARAGVPERQLAPEQRIGQGPEAGTPWVPRQVTA